MDLHSFLQQCVQRASKPSALSVTTWPTGIPAWWLYHHTHLHHQGQPVLTGADEMETFTETCLKIHAWVHMNVLQGHAAPQKALLPPTPSVALQLKNSLTSNRCLQRQMTAVLSAGHLSVITCLLLSSSKEECHWKCQQDVQSSLSAHLQCKVTWKAERFSPQQIVSWILCCDSYDRRKNTKKKNSSFQTEMNAKGGFLH